jgi:DNA-directed RNA polymerase subunit P
MMYVCQNCGKKIEKIENFITCPYCGYKILVKERPPVVKKVKAE